MAIGRFTANAIRLATRDYVHESRISICHVLALMAVLAPLLVLFGLRFGLVDTMAKRLIEDPRNREITPAGSGRYDTAFLSELGALEGVGFVVANTRSIAASFALVRGPTGETAQGLAMIPSGAGDPLLGDGVAIPMGPTEVVLSPGASRRLGAQAGSTINAEVTRQLGGQRESVRVDLQVVGVAKQPTVPDEVAFVPLQLLVATEDWRDGLAVPDYGWRGDPRPETARLFARFRLYAKSIYDVGVIEENLRGRGIEVRTNAGEIQSMQALDENLGQVFWLIAACGAGGFLASFAATLLASVERKRRDLSMLRLIGLPSRQVVLFPVIQAGLTAVLGAVSAIGVAYAFSFTLNRLFADSLREGELICRLLPQHVVIAILVTLVAATVAAAWAGARASRIEPAEGIRDV